MRKITLLILPLLFSCILANAQYWVLPNVNAGTNPNSINTDAEEPLAAITGWTSIIGSNVTTPTWSANQTIPFTFQFNSMAETQYKVSSTGVLTFDVASVVAAPGMTNTALPSASIPDKSVVIWGGFQSSGANDNVITKVFGAAPNRQLWIQFNSCTTPLAVASFSYWAIVLEETSNKIYIVDQRTYDGNQGTGNVAVTAGIQINSTTAISVNGSPSLASATIATAFNDPTDNTYYTFTPGLQPTDDLFLSDLTPHDGAGNSFFVAPGSASLNATVTNYGSATVTGFTFGYDDGSSIQTMNVTGVNIAPFGTHTFQVTPTVNIPQNGHIAITGWVTLSGDNLNDNDTLTTGVTGVSFLPIHNVTFEEGTGTWCGWCPRGAVYMDSIAKMKNDVVVIAVHNSTSDPMQVPTYDAGISAMVGGYPSIVIDRKVVDDPSAAFDEYTALKSDFGFADLTMTNTFTGMNVTSVVSAHFALDLNNANIRLAFVPTEDDVTGTSSGYNQVNYYGANSIPLNGAGHTWGTDPNPVLAANMEYDHVARDIQGTFNGFANAFPLAITAGSTQSYTFNYTVPSTSNITKMKMAALLIDDNSGMILNGVQKRIVPLGYENINKDNSLTINLFPNPATDYISVLGLNNNETASFTITNSIGQVVAEQSVSTLQNIDISKLNIGNYIITVKTANAVSTKKFTKM
ncbi:MAG: hypothetical protein RL065_2225 [Bacteroidota bacterium]|jgi:thiol-disulfide isomerase/thioredoxin